MKIKEWEGKEYKNVNCFAYLPHFSICYKDYIMRLITASSIFVYSLFFGTFIPGILADSNIDDITLRTIGAPNSLDYEVYYGKYLTNKSYKYTNINIEI